MIGQSVTFGLVGRTRPQELTDYASPCDFGYPIRDYLRSFGWP